MDGLSFELARPEHAASVVAMRTASAADLAEKLGDGHWSGSTKLASVRERIKGADLDVLRRTTLFVACRDGEVVGSVTVSTFPPGFWRQSYWRSGKEAGLGVFNLVVPPALQRQGIGRFMMREIERLATERGIRFIRLDAYSANPFSTAFYRAIGYEERAVIDLRGVGLVLFENEIE
jgi:ribosomal protein S18 acetylase RimI-like enzyme